MFLILPSDYVESASPRPLQPPRKELEDRRSRGRIV